MFSHLRFNVGLGAKYKLYKTVIYFSVEQRTNKQNASTKDGICLANLWHFASNFRL